MYDPKASRRLLELVDELARRRSIDIPPTDPYPEQQEVYERYLRSLLLNPQDVDRVIDSARLPEEKRAEISAMMLQGLLNSDKMPDSELKALLLLVRLQFGEQRASGLVRTIASPLVNAAAAQGFNLSRPFAMGVFSLRWFNAQCDVFEGTPVLLLATGSFDLIEIFTTLLQAHIKKASDYATSNMRQALQQYVETGDVKKADYGLGQGVVEFSNLTYGAITTSAEQFIVGHEMAHVALGHLGASSRGAAPIAGVQLQTTKSIEAVQPSHFDEYCADAWGFLLSIKAATLSKNENDLPIACAGATIFLGLAMLIEHISKLKNVRIANSHPPASTRLYLTELLLEITGNHEKAFVARRAREFVEEIGKAYAGFEMPPLLARDLNSIAVPVFEHIRIDLSGARYITEFT